MSNWTVKIDNTQVPHIKKVSYNDHPTVYDAGRDMAGINTYTYIGKIPEVLIECSPMLADEWQEFYNACLVNLTHTNVTIFNTLTGQTETWNNCYHSEVQANPVLGNPNLLEGIKFSIISNEPQ